MKDARQRLVDINQALLEEVDLIMDKPEPLPVHEQARLNAMADAVVVLESYLYPTEVNEDESRDWGMEWHDTSMELA